MKEKLHYWLVCHDERLSFNIFYVSLAVILSVCISIFWLILLVIFHGFLEYYRQSYKNPDLSFFKISARALWFIKLDISLVFFSLLIGVYMDLIIGFAGLGSLARVGIQGAKGGARFLLIEKSIKAFLLSLDDLAQLFRVVLRKKNLKSGKMDKGKKYAECIKNLSEEKSPSINTGDKLCLIFGSLCLLLLVLSPWLSNQSFYEVFMRLKAELHPWPPLMQGM